ncbi:MAG: CatB-related O-acetyltransferase [Bacteroidota bacterium]
MIRSAYRNFKNILQYSSFKNIKIGNNVATNNSLLEGKNKIYDNTVLINSKLGRGSYIGMDCYFNGAEIGRYCSIGYQVKVITATHPSRRFVSTHPAFFSLSKQAGYTYVTESLFQEHKLLDEQGGISVSIGNDVWIGDEVKIMGGVKIHDGAIIGARALVTKDVPPYSIVGGVPAKVIGKRFTDPEIEFLIRFRWWDKDESWIIKNANLFSDIKQFMSEIGFNKPDGNYL